MTDSVALLHAFASVEKAAFVIVPGALLALWWACRRLPPVPQKADSPASVLTASEIGLLLLILAGALLLRVLWWDRGIPGTIFGGEIMTARAEAALRRGDYWTQWWNLVRGLQVSSWQYDSPIIQPFLLAFHAVVPPRLHGIVIFGALVGTLGVGLAWLAGRLLHGPRVGLLLAGVLAVSPLQVVWSRLGYRAIAAIPHVFLVIALATLAGRRRSAVLAVLVGVVGYATVYNYEGARVVLPLAFVAIWAGASGGSRRVRRVLGLSLLTAATVATLALTVPRVGLKQTLWPNYAGYAGNQGESGLGDLLRRNQERLRVEGVRSLDAYFRVNRSGPPYAAIWSWGIQYGGLTFLPLTVLGVIGLLVAPSFGWGALVWFGTLVLGLAMPALGCASARRLIIFDLAWCAFAAFGLAYLPRTALLRRVPLRHRPALAAAFLGLTGAWTFAAMAILGRGPSDAAVYQVPFGTGCVGDVVSCPRCAEVARRWEGDIRNGDLTILLDSDVQRENPTAPAGLTLFGQLAAVAAGRPDWFQEIHPIIWNLTFVPDFRQYYSPDSSPAAYLSRLLKASPYRRLLWHSEHPTAWDRALARRLVAAGGRLETFSTPLGAGPGFRVETDKADEDAVLATVAAMLPDAAAQPASCVVMTRVRADPMPFAPNALAAVAGADATDPTPWLAIGYHQVSGAGGMTLPLPAVRHAMPGAADAAATIRVLQANGLEITLAWPAGTQIANRLTHLGPVGRHCAAVVGGQWWVVDPESGVLRAAALPPSIPARGEWMGIASDQRSQLLLASAEQELVALDAGTGTETFRLRAPITSTERMEEAGQCIQLVRGGGWFGVFDGLRNRLHLYKDPGVPLGALELTALGFPGVRALAARGAFLALATPDRVTTVQLDLSGCPG